MFSKHFESVFYTYTKCITECSLETFQSISWIHLERCFKHIQNALQNAFNKHLKDALKMFLKHCERVFYTYTKCITECSLETFQSSSWIHLESVF